LITLWLTRPTNLCSLDVPKAFDKVNHSALFLKLMKRNVPSAFIDVLINWYSNCVCIVKWNSGLSMCYSQLCSVREGGVVSLVLFTIDIDDLILKLVEANLAVILVM